MDVVDDAALLIECVSHGRRASVGVLELIAKICIGLLKIFPNTDLTAASLTDDEAEGGR